MSKVLRNGDAVPLIPGLNPQPPVEEFIKDYVKDGKIVLDENEAIFLFELGTTDLNSTAADYPGPCSSAEGRFSACKLILYKLKF